MQHTQNLGLTSALPATTRPGLLLYLARYQYNQKNAIAATLAWVAETAGLSFEVYYDAIHFGRHYGSGNPTDQGLWRQTGLGLQTGGLVAGGRHLEACALALQRFRVAAISSGEVAFSNSIRALAEVSGATFDAFSEADIIGLYEAVFSTLKLEWPEVAVVVTRNPSRDLSDIDAYMYPEIFNRCALGIEATASARTFNDVRQRGTKQIIAHGLPGERLSELAGMGFRVEELEPLRTDDDHAAVTARLAKRWSSRETGWILGDPVVTSYWLPAACRDRRVSVYSIPQSRVADLLDEELRRTQLPSILGRQADDSDFFTLSRLGHSFQVIDPCRPPLPILQTLKTPWPQASRMTDQANQDPTDAELLAYARQGAVLASVVFWTGMMREVENLFALMDLVSMHGLKGGIVLTAQSFRWRPSPLDLLTVPVDQGGVYPDLEVLLGSCGNGVAIESLLSADHLSTHLKNAQAELDDLEVPSALRPIGWWSTMDADMVPANRRQSAKPIRLRRNKPYVQIRFHRKGSVANIPSATSASTISQPSRTQSLRTRFGSLVRGSRVEALFDAYRPYENFRPGRPSPQVLQTVKAAGFEYMLTKSAFKDGPRVVHRDGDFVAVNYTTGQWDGWTPFETINDRRDLLTSERKLLGRRKAGWLIGTIDSCLWTFSGELWTRAADLNAIAEFFARGGASGKLINVPPRVIARYARILDESDVA